jgi:hypothetical protein
MSSTFCSRAAWVLGWFLSALTDAVFGVDSSIGFTALEGGAAARGAGGVLLRVLAAGAPPRESVLLGGMVFGGLVGLAGVALVVALGAVFDTVFVVDFVGAFVGLGTDLDADFDVALPAVGGDEATAFFGAAALDTCFCTAGRFFSGGFAFDGF